MRKLILTIFLFILLLAVAHSEWEDRTEVEEAVYSVDTIQSVEYNHWLDQVDRDSVQVIFKEEHYTLYTESGPNYSSLGVGGETDSVLYDTVRYYRK